MHQERSVFGHPRWLVCLWTARLGELTWNVYSIVIDATEVNCWLYELRGVDLTAEFDSWYEESFLGGVTADRPAAQAASAANVAAGKPETLSKADTCVRYAFDCSSQQLFLSNSHFVVTSPAGAVAKCCDEYVCLWVCLSVCLSARISPEPHARSLPIFLCMLPISVARSSCGMFTIGRIADHREGVFFSIENALSSGKGLCECTARAKCAVYTISLLPLVSSPDEVHR